MNGSSLAYFILFVGIQVEWSDANRHTIIRPGWSQPSWWYHGGSVAKRRNLGLPGNNLTKWSVLHLNLRPPDHRTSASTTRQRRLLMRMCSSLWVCLCVYIAVRLSASRSETTTHTNSSRTKLFFYCFLALPETNVNIFVDLFKLWMHRVWTAGFFSLYKVIQGVRTFIPHTFFQEQDLIAQNPFITFFRHFCFHDHSNFSFKALDWSRFNMG